MRTRTNLRTVLISGRKFKISFQQNGFNSPRQIPPHRIPVRKFVGAEVDVFAGEAVGPVGGTVVDEVITNMQMFVVRENEALVGWFSEVLFDPL